MLTPPSTFRAEIDQHNHSLQWPVFTLALLAGFARAMTQAITADKLVLEPDLGYGLSGKMFWVRIPNAQTEIGSV